MLVNRESIQGMFQGFNAIFQDAWQQAPSMWDRVATEVPSSAGEEVYGWLGTNPRFREWVGDRVLQSLKANGMVIKNKSFESTIEVDKDDVEDDKLGIYKPLIQQMGQESRTHPDELVFGLVNSGFNTVCFDGQYFFDTDHPVEQADGTMGTWSNFGGGSGTAWFLLDCTRPIKPFIFQKRRDYKPTYMVDDTDEAVFMRKKFRYGVDARGNVGFGLPHLAYASKQTLDVTNYAAARAALQSVKGDKGKVLNIGTGKTILMVPPSLEKAALEVIKAERNANGQTNVMMGLSDPLVNAWLA